MSYRQFRNVWLGAAMALAGAACAAGSNDDASADSSTSGSGGATSSTGVGGDPSNATTGTGGDENITTGTTTPGDGCSDEAKLVYVLGKTQELYSFNPGTLALTQLGVLSCPAGTATPFSMSVDRSGTAWVLYNDGNLFNVDTKTVACTATSFVPDQQGYKKFGMGFVSDAPGSTQETLYIANEFGIASLDTTTLTVNPIGSFGFSAAAELTGTGDAKLYGFFFGFPPYLSEIDKATSALLTDVPLDSIDAGTGFAFAFWGGDFWIFTAPGSVSSQIDRYQPATGSTTTVNFDVGFKIVGAGVSTCAPVEPPS